MEKNKEFVIDYIEIYTPMAKILAYWHTEALGFTLEGVMNYETGSPGISSYVLSSNEIKIILTTTYPPFKSEYQEVSSFISANYCGVKKIALKVPCVEDYFHSSIEKGAIPIKFPTTLEDEFGTVKEATIKFYDNNEIVFTNRDSYKGVFKPGYKTKINNKIKGESLLKEIDHIASEVRVNESSYWTKYLGDIIGTDLVQDISESKENKTGMVLRVNQTEDKKLTFVIAEPHGCDKRSKVQQNIDSFGAGIHHLAFTTENLFETAKNLISKGVDFVSFPSAYYDLLRSNSDFKNINIDELQSMNIICDKEGDTYLFQKFIKPISDRPFFLYEIVQRINGYNGFAIKNINTLKQAEEIQIMKENS